jgi:hypothetical protein
VEILGVLVKELVHTALPAAPCVRTVVA